ncbi:replication initiation protein [Lacticaseibacillus suibinensis]|uniref:replication initiation protein n=1 Tax=Lacticaseibacillus suibinensis TaxID=2486011 RepID=UPI001943C007|nr:replication initiation protein [Lacticaseibacillus suibinensis]
MAVVGNKKMNGALDKLLDRQDYLVTQANDLARSLGNLSTFEHKVLDYCFSYVKKDDDASKVYHLSALEVINHLGLNKSGDSYARVVAAFKGLNESTAIYMQSTEPDGRKGILMTSLFSHIKVIEDGEIEFGFNQLVAPYVFQLKERFYSFRLSELSQVRSKYTLALMKLWNANARGKWSDRDDPNSLPPAATIEGDLEDWEAWFLGSDEKGKPIRWPAGRFKQKAIDVAVKELARLYPNSVIDITTHTKSRHVVGYTIEFRSMHTILNMNTLVVDGRKQ